MFIAALDRPPVEGPLAKSLITFASRGSQFGFGEFRIDPCVRRWLLASHKCSIDHFQDVDPKT